MFCRRLYYDRTTGEVLASYMRYGAVHLTTEQEDATIYPSLAGRNVDCMQWDIASEDVEASFAAACVPCIDISSGEAVLSFRNPDSTVPDGTVEYWQSAYLDAEMRLACLELGIDNLLEGGETI